MKRKPKQGRSILGWILWLIVRLAVCVAVAALAEYEPSLLKKQSPEMLRNLSLGASAVFGFLSLTYLYWAIRYSSSDGYRPSALARVGLLCSGIGALLLSGKIGFPEHLPGHTSTYVLTAMLLSFVIRPILDHFGWKTTVEPQQ